MMKYCFRLLFIFVLLDFSSCKKDKDYIENKNIYGLWELRKTAGGLSPYKEYPSGNGYKLNFKGDGKVDQYIDNQLASTIRFQTAKYSGSCDYAKGDMAIIYDGDKDGQVVFEIKSDTLVISGPPCWNDVGFSSYVRIGN